MKEQWEKECADLRAELVALQIKLHTLETKGGGATASAPTLSRWRLSKSVMMVVLPVVVLLAMGGVLYGQGAVDALFIDLNGNVGIGRTDPKATLDVAGTLNVTQKTSLADTTIKGPLTTEGNVGIGTPPPTQVPPEPAKLEVSLFAKKWDDGNLRWLRLIAPDPKYALDVNAHVIKSGEVVGFHFRPNVGTKADSGLVIASDGNVGIGATAPHDKLDVAGPLRVLTGSNPIRFTSGWSGFPNESGVTNQAEIANDTKDYKALMIVGNMSAGGTTRRVKVFDQLDVAGDLVVNGLPIRKVISGNPPKNDGWITETVPIDPYCSDSDGCRVKIVSEPPGGRSQSFKTIIIDIAVSSGGRGNTRVLPNG